MSQDARITELEERVRILEAAIAMTYEIRQELLEGLALAATLTDINIHSGITAERLAAELAPNVLPLRSRLPLPSRRAIGRGMSAGMILLAGLMPFLGGCSAG